MLKIKCRKHPKFSGVQSPRASCEACVYLWEVRQKAFERRLEVVEARKIVVEKEEENAR